MEEFKIRDEVVVTHSTDRNGETGIVTGYRGGNTYVLIVKFDDGDEIPYHKEYLRKTGKIIHDKTQISSGITKNFTKIGTEIGEFTDKKNLQYGSSVDATSKMIHILLERYTYDEEQYLIPKSLIDHLLLQSRMMDKQNRIFNNPSGKGDSESPYKDLAGYSIIGIDMANGNDFTNVTRGAAK